MTVKPLKITGGDLVNKLSRGTDETMDLEMNLTSGLFVRDVSIAGGKID